jgi:phage terminase small subunit
MEYLMDVMNHEKMPFAMRLDAAKALLPYMHERVGEKGKKEQAAERAKVVAGGKGSRGPFSPKAPPQLRVVKTE